MKNGKPQVFTLMAELSGPLPGKFDDWPARVQDGIMAALERKSKETELPLVIVDSYCDSDFHGKFYAYVIASEIIVGRKGVKGGTLLN